MNLSENILGTRDLAEYHHTGTDPYSPQNMLLNQNFQGMGGLNLKIFHGKDVDIFWNNKFAQIIHELFNLVPGVLKSYFGNSRNGAYLFIFDVNILSYVYHECSN